jgi:cation:H+ antiporter
MLTQILFLLGGLALILVGASALTDGAASIARRYGLSDMVIGLTIVAFGTSAPELVISAVSAWQHSAGLAIGNVVGSNIFNICAIIGITAMVRPIKVTRSIMTNEIPLVVLSSLALLAMGNGPLLNSTSERILTRTDGIVLLLFFLIFMRYTFAEAKSAAPSEPIKQQAEQCPAMPLWQAIVYVAAGLAALVFGGDIFVEGASGIARMLGVSEAVIGLTIVAAGTSLPELATAVVAALKGHTDIALGNVIGSNIFNIFMVAGCAATISPLSFGSIDNFDLLVLTGACLLFWFFGGYFGKRIIMRAEGAALFLIYVIYISCLIVKA